MNNTSRLASLCGFTGPQSVPLDKLHEVAADRLEAARELHEALNALVSEMVETGFALEWDNYLPARAALAKYRGEA